MKTALAILLTSFIFMIYLFEPLLHEIHQQWSYAVENTIERGIEQACSADNGRFTPEIIQDMKDSLSKKFYIPAASIQFSGTTTLTPRGEVITGSLTIKSIPIWIFDTSNDPNNYIIRSATMMSEYMVRG